jgi:hypothetical protein
LASHIVVRKHGYDPRMPTRSSIAEARVYDSWLDYQEALKRAIAPLSAAQLRARPLPDQRSAGAVAEHIVFGRALHLHHTLGAKATELVVLHRWGDDGHSPQSAAAIVAGLDLTWRFISDSVMRGVAGDSLSDAEAAVVQTIWGLLDHDLPHAGELSLLLGAAGLPGVEF